MRATQGHFSFAVRIFELRPDVPSRTIHVGGLPANTTASLGDGEGPSRGTRSGGSGPLDRRNRIHLIPRLWVSARGCRHNPPISRDGGGNGGSVAQAVGDGGRASRSPSAELVANLGLVGVVAVDPGGQFVGRKEGETGSSCPRRHSGRRLPGEDHEDDFRPIANTIFADLIAGVDVQRCPRLARQVAVTSTARSGAGSWPMTSRSLPRIQIEPGEVIALVLLGSRLRLDAFEERHSAQGRRKGGYGGRRRMSSIRPPSRDFSVVHGSARAHDRQSSLCGTCGNVTLARPGRGAGVGRRAQEAGICCQRSLP